MTTKEKLERLTDVLVTKTKENIVTWRKSDGKYDEFFTKIKHGSINLKKEYSSWVMIVYGMDDSRLITVTLKDDHKLPEAARYQALDVENVINGMLEDLKELSNNKEDA